MKLKEAGTMKTWLMISWIVGILSLIKIDKITGFCNCFTYRGPSTVIVIGNLKRTRGTVACHHNCGAASFVCGSGSWNFAVPVPTMLEKIGKFCYW
jgi:hypothetical protein